MKDTLKREDGAAVYVTASFPRSRRGFPGAAAGRGSTSIVGRSPRHGGSPKGTGATGKKERRKGEEKSRGEPSPFLSASQTAAKGNTLYMPTTFPKCSVQFFAATSADPDERVTHRGSSRTQGRTRTCSPTVHRECVSTHTCPAAYLSTCTFCLCTGCSWRINRGTCAAIHPNMV